MPRDSEERQIALECLRLANRFDSSAEVVVDDAARYFAFVTGDDSADKLAKVREAIR